MYNITWYVGYNTMNPLIIPITWGILFFSAIGVTGYDAITNEPKFEHLLFIIITVICVFPTILIWVYLEARQNEQKLKNK